MPDLLSVYDFDKRDADAYLSEAAKMEALLAKGRPLRTLSGKIVANLFFEASTRTNFSFQSAAARLGATPIVFYSDKSSAQKGESFSDTIQMMDGYADCLVIRHPEPGMPSLAAEIAGHPVINAGDGGNQHPTQALIDIYTIKKLKGKIAGLNVTLMGDLKHARAMRSLLHLLAMYGASISLCSPSQLAMGPEVIARAKKEFGASIREASKPSFAGCDILYICRVQRERFADPDEALRMSSAFRLGIGALRAAPKGMAVLHPLPKLDELPKEFDSDARAKYFEQAKNAVPVRMAILKRCCLGK
ncbi:MAG: aspartate carbamoyltransferase [Candidatus Micrarchaeota archaeon]|nr:aspartate carbamoyltransferase [Candidatus Micrarchaeota archaeon]